MALSKIPKSLLIMMAMLIGILVGLQSGQLVWGIEQLARAFVVLLQMSALPYISLSLIVGIGSLTPSILKNTLSQGIMSLFILIVIVLTFLMFAPIAFPDWENASFYSPGIIEAQPSLSLVELFIPSNPFYALAHGVIPSVVVFSIFLGLGLMRLKHKKYSLTVLNSLKDSVANINSTVMTFAPLGVFCIGFKAAVTIDASQLDGLAVYLSTAGALVLLLVFVVLPVLVSILTPFSYKQIVSASREAMITAFATGSFFAVVPTIVEKTRELIALLPSKNNIEVTSVANIVVPISFSLPVGGKLLALLFPLFAAWFSGAYISFSDYFDLVFSGLPQLFGPNMTSMPILLDIFNVSNTMYDLFIISENLLVGRLGALLSVMFSTVLPLLIAAFIVRKVRFNGKRFARALIIIPIFSVIIFFSLRISFDSISHQYQGYSKFIERDFIFTPVGSTYLDEPENHSLSPLHAGDVLSKIKERGFLRVGYFRDDLPYSFHNNEGKLVGFDIEIFNQLAIDLDVEIQFVKIFRDQAERLLASGYLDITSGVPLIPDNMKELSLTVPYSKQSLAFLVKGNRRSEFTTWHDIIKDPDRIIGIPETFFYTKAVERIFVHGKAWEISTPRLFFKSEYQHIDGMLFGSAAASAWSLLYPEYTVVVPKPVLPALSMAFPINKDDLAFELFMRNWIMMKTDNKTIERLFTYWISGKNTAPLFSDE